MKRRCLSFAGPCVAITVLASSLSACSSDETSPSASGGSSAGSVAVAGSPSQSGAAGSTQGGSTSQGGGSAGSSTGGSSTGGSSTGGAPAGGAAAQAGSAGTQPGGGGAPANVILSTDFESDAVGKQPAGWHNFLAYNIDAMNPQANIQAIVDATRPHGGKNSLHVKGGSSPAFLTYPLASGTNKLYVRGYFYMTRQLGQVESQAANHETLFGIRKDKENEIRFGEIKGAIGMNETPTDKIFPKTDLWHKGPLIAATKWVCIEGAFIGDQAQHEFHAWADGTEVLSVTSGEWANGVMPATWLNDKWTEFMIGWQSFDDASNEIWIDDLVLAKSRINCQ